MTRKKFLSFFPIGFFTIGLLSLLAGRAVPQIGESPVLARVELGALLPDLPLQAILQDVNGRDYALVIAKPSRLRSVGANYRLLEANARASDYMIAFERRPGARQVAALLFQVLEDDGRSIILRLPAGQEDRLSALGFDLQRLDESPMVMRASVRAPVARISVPDPAITAMIAQVQSATASEYVNQLSGAKPASIGGSSYTLMTRHTSSGTPIAMATQLVYERLAALGLNTSYHDWSAPGYSGRNVIGELNGTVLPGEIVLVTAHLDDMPSGATAPGADDNASGSSGIWIAANILSRYRFQRTLRFVFFTGEEQGLFGSSRYAAAAAGRGENIVAVFNLDMIAWDSKNGPTLRLHTRAQTNPGYAGDAAIANAFVDVVNTYGLSGQLTPIVTADGESASDHASFWARGYPAIMAIEDDLNDFTPHYHTTGDSYATLNLTYFTNYVKAAVGTAAQLALPAAVAGPSISLSRRNLFYGASSGGAETSTQSVIIGNSGTGTLTWTAVSDRNWLNVAPASGSGAGILQIGVNPGGLPVGTWPGTITVSDPNASNSPQAIAISLTVKGAGQSGPPFGEFSTPTDGTAGVTGAIPVTGWVVDDVETASVRIFRDPTGGEGVGLVFIGEAIFVEGARPDIENAFPGYPINYRAGWGYMLLTNSLPNGGNGRYKIHAFAADKEGSQVWLGTKTITCSNATAVKPFGTIDSPPQGGDASGNSYWNFGWVLTPQTKTMPKNGSTILVYVDGAYAGNLGTAPNVYNQYRADVSTAFPGLNNTGAPGAGGPVGAFFLDTTKYANGVHTIHWIATDDAGAADGIGSRYVNIVNTGTTTQASSQTIILELADSYESVMNLPVSFESLRLKRGFNLKTEPEVLQPDNYGTIHFQIKEIERIEMELGEDEGYRGYLLVGEKLRPLPIGSTLDPRTGRFSWLPGPGFVGSYDLIFIHEDGLSGKRRIPFKVTIRPRFEKR